MLPSLLMRDWILHRRALLPVFLIFAAFQVYFVLVVDKPLLWVVFTSVFVSFLTINPLTRDDKFRAALWSCTLPVSRADLVRAKYAGSWMQAAGGFLLALALGALVPGSRLAPALPVDPGALLLAASIITVILALLLPFTVRFGVLGVFIGLGSIQVIAAVLFVVSKATGTMDQVEMNIAAPFRPLVAGVGAARESLPRPVFYIAALIVLALLNWAGYRLALALFRRKEL